MANTNAKTEVAGKLSLKLLIDTTAQKVLFAEAGKEVVDFLFSLLSLPLGSIVKLLSKDKDRMKGSIGNLYKSIQELNDSYIQNSKGKSILLNPIRSNISPSLLLPGPSSSSSENVYFQCYYCTTRQGCVGYFSKVNGLPCPNCKNSMTKQMIYVEGVEKEDVDPNVGFVKGVVTYTIMDDLTVTPMSSISSITLLSKFNVKNLNALVERDVTLGFEEALTVLEISLLSKKVLTSVFLDKK